jgi:hypothetical protein
VGRRVLLPRLLYRILKGGCSGICKNCKELKQNQLPKDSVELFWADKGVELSPDGDNKDYYKYQSLVVAKYS